jgi:hypothetical protein
MGKKTVAELLVELITREVPRIYGAAGDSLNGITDSNRRQDLLHHVRVSLYHRPLVVVTRFAAELAGRLSGQVDSAALATKESASGKDGAHDSETFNHTLTG